MLNERNQANKERKNQVLGRTPKTPPREHADREVHDHGSNPETVGEKRGVKKVRGQKKDVPGLLKRIYKQSGLRTRAERAKTMLKRFTSGPKGKLPDHTVYHDMGYLMAESLGLVSEERTRIMQNKAGVEQRRRDSGVQQSAQPPTRGGENEAEEEERRRTEAEQRQAEKSKNMIGANEEPSGAKRSREARKRGGTKERVEAAQGVRYRLGTRRPSRRGTTKVTVKPSTKKKVMKTPKPPKYK